MRDQITINRIVTQTSSTGARTSNGTPTALGTYYAKVRKVTDDQDMVASFNTVEDIYEFTIRNQVNSGVTVMTKDVVVWDSNTYQVIGISDQSLQKRFVVIKGALINPT